MGIYDPKLEHFEEASGNKTYSEKEVRKKVLDFCEKKGIDREEADNVLKWERFKFSNEVQ